MKRFNFERFTRLKNKIKRKWRNVCFWKRNRYGTSFNDELRNKITESAGIGAYETLLMMLDDSRFRTRDKNVVLTSRRILWQNIKGGKYESVELERLKGASVFAERAGNKTVLCMVSTNADKNEDAEYTTSMFSPVIVEIHLKYFTLPDTLRIIFHDYLSKYCPGYLPFNKDNYQYYKKTVSPLLHKTPVAGTVLSIIGIAALCVLALFNVAASVSGGVAPIEKIMQIIVCSLLMLAMLSWTVNVIIPDTKSKLSKLLLLLVFAAGCFKTNYYRDLPCIQKCISTDSLTLTNQVLLAVKAAFALLWLLFDKVNFDRVTRIAAAVLAGLSILLALMGLAAGIRFSFR